MRIVILLLALFSFVGNGATAIESVLTERVLSLAVVSANLSALAYENATEYATFDANGNVTGYFHPEYESISFYTEEPDQAIVAQKDGYCFIAFRGTTVSGADWDQNIDIRNEEAYKNNDTSTGEFCTVRRGYADFLRTSEVDRANQELLACIPTCADPNDCVIITGHSQGGASAAIASIYTYDLMPTVITFGMPPAAKAGCELIPSERLYRFVNHRKEENEEGDLGFDPVPFVPTLFSRAVHYGYYLMVGPDPTAAKFLGIDEEGTFSPLINDDNEIDSHSLQGKNYSYLTRVENLLATGQETGFPVSMDGYTDGTICEIPYRELCASGSCQNNTCSQPLTDLCIKGSCERDEDCASGVCIWDACASANGEVAGGCPCQSNANCKSGDCDTKFTSLDWVCEYGPDEVQASGSPAAKHSLCVQCLIALVVMLGSISFFV